MKKKLFSIIAAGAALVTGIVASACVTDKMAAGKTEKAQQMSDKHLNLFLMMNQWVRVRQKGKNLADYFEREGYKNIAVYGMSHAGETLVNELRDSGIHVCYGIDQNPLDVYADVNVYSMQDKLEAVDAIVVTAIAYFDEIEEKLAEKISCPVLSLEDIVYET